MTFKPPEVARQLQNETSAGYCMPLAEAAETGPHRINHAAKRFFDIMVSFILLFLFAPVLLFVALAVKTDGGPALFRHTRIGLRGHGFGCLKFRSMSVTAEQDLAAYLTQNPAAAEEWAMRRKLQHDPRITRIGRFLRATSLDELPQLVNVLRGEMSLIGPRPVVREELEQHYSAIGQRAYAATPPGITGLWQVSGRSGTSYSERVRLDIAYVEDWSIQKDIMILLRTIPAVLRRKGAL
ncbi:sugar transferase [Acidocella sp.]|uniref:sugar transferase n=1 Tax=Acidocella sp. TaxID=50710 RepID=UPI00263506E6|nr:sugar transferase [Acidocella sp.]